VLVALGIIVLRRREPDRPRPFRTPWVPVLPLVSAAFCLYLMINLPLLTWVRFGLNTPSECPCAESTTITSHPASSSARARASASDVPPTADARARASASDVPPTAAATRSRP